MIHHSKKALPVLARILTDRKLLNSPIGITAISAAAVDDAVSWTFLALTISLFNATNPLTALYTFITTAVFAAFMLMVVSRGLSRFYDWRLLMSPNRDTRHFVPEEMMVVSLVTMMIAAFFTSAIGIHSMYVLKRKE